MTYTNISTYNELFYVQAYRDDATFYSNPIQSFISDNKGHSC